MQPEQQQEQRHPRPATAQVPLGSVFVNQYCPTLETGNDHESTVNCPDIGIMAKAERKYPVRSRKILFHNRGPGEYAARVVLDGQEVTEGFLPLSADASQVIAVEFVRRTSFLGQFGVEAKEIGGSSGASALISTLFEEYVEVPTAVLAGLRARGEELLLAEGDLFVARRTRSAVAGVGFGSGTGEEGASLVIPARERVRTLDSIHAMTSGIAYFAVKEKQAGSDLLVGHLPITEVFVPPCNLVFEGPIPIPPNVEEMWVEIARTEECAGSLAAVFSDWRLEQRYADFLAEVAP